MDEGILSLALVGWIYAIGCGLALVLGAWLVVSLHMKGGEGARRQLASRVLDDTVLFGIWILGLAGGVGVLQGKDWSRWVLELFCWVLAALVVFSVISRWRAAPKPRGLLGFSLAVFALPIIAFCAATILTLRSEAAVRALAG